MRRVEVFQNTSIYVLRKILLPSLICIALFSLHRSCPLSLQTVQHGIETEQVLEYGVEAKYINL